MQKADGMNYAPKGKINPVCKKGDFPFAAIGLDHGHIYAMCNGLTEAGAELKWVYDTDSDKIEKFCKSYPEVKAASSEETMDIVPSPTPSHSLLCIAWLLRGGEQIHFIPSSLSS